MSTIKVVNIQHPDSVDPNLVLQAEGDTVFASGITVSGTFDIANDLTVSGNTGLGTSSPSSKLHVVDTTTNLQLESTANSSSGKIDFIGKDSSSNSYRTLTIDTSSTGEVNIETDPDNGGYSTDKSIIFKQAGSEKVRIDNSGNVGIGTSSPDEPLDVRGGAFASNQDFGIQLGVPGGQWKSGLKIKSGSGGAPRVALDVASDNSGGTIEALSLVGGGNAGNVGIGTSGPSTRLTIDNTTPIDATNIASAGELGNVYLEMSSGGTQGTGNLGPSINFTGINQSGVDGRKAAIVAQQTGANSSQVGLSFWTNNTADSSGVIQNRMVISGSGNVGIGTDTPTDKFVLQDGNQLIQNDTTSGNLTLSTHVDSNGEAQIRINKARGGVSGPSQITAGDDLGDIQIRGYDGSAYNVAFKIRCTSTTNTGNFAPNTKFTNDGTDKITFRSDGDVQCHTNLWNNSAPAIGNNGYYFANSGIHKLSRNAGAASNIFQVLGQVGQFQIKGDGDAQNTNNNYGALSDIKLKENIVDANSQWDDIKAIQIRNYNFKADTPYATHTQIGVIAQELEIVCPKLVKDGIDEDADGNDLGTVTKTVSYSVLYMKAVKALQEAMTRIEELETKVAALEAAN